jgi:hypothetical protein
MTKAEEEGRDNGKEREKKFIGEGVNRRELDSPGEEVL